MSKWEVVGKQMVINLENAREQYKVLGYPHRTVLKMRCPLYGGGDAEWRTIGIVAFVKI